MNRGSARGRAIIDGRAAASMRPRFMNRGSTGPRSASPTSRPSFNEAPIHESGKSYIHYRMLAHASGFNEAPIHESGKLPVCLPVLPNALAASMRPRFMNRGSMH